MLCQLSGLPSPAQGGLEKGGAVNLLNPDFSEGFAVESFEKLLAKMRISGGILRWAKLWLEEMALGQGY